MTFQEFLRYRIAELNIVIECETDSYDRDAAIAMRDEYRELATA